MYLNNGSNPCRRGPECSFLKRGNCWFYHPPSHSRPASQSRVMPSSSPSMINSTLRIGRLYEDPDNDFQDYDWGDRHSQEAEEVEDEDEEHLYEDDGDEYQQYDDDDDENEDICDVEDEEDNYQDQYQEEYGNEDQVNGVNVINSLAGTIFEYNGLSLSRQTQSRQQNKFFALNRGFSNILRLKQAKETKQNEIKNKTLSNQLKVINGKQIRCEKYNSSLAKQKNWYFENAYHFKFVKECGYQQCSICIGKFGSDQLTTQLLCKHAFHTSCIQDWLKISDNCPLCRKDFKDHQQYKKMVGYPKNLLWYLQLGLGLEW